MKQFCFLAVRFHYLLAGFALACCIFEAAHGHWGMVHVGALVCSLNIVLALAIDTQQPSPTLHYPEGGPESLEYRITAESRHEIRATDNEDLGAEEESK